MHDAKRKLVREFKDRPCTDCGIKYPFYVMELDHIIEKDGTYHADGKQNCVGITMYRRGMAWLKEELTKCEVVCANCHRERTYRRSNDHIS